MRFAPIAFLYVPLLFGQTATFEVASLKPSAPSPARFALLHMDGGPGTSDPTRISYRNIPLILLITQAYDVNGADVSGPSFATAMTLMGTENSYDIEARLPAGTTKEGLREMMRNLIEDRFHMTVHREKKEVPAYALVQGKDGAKIRQSPPVPADADPPEKVNVAVKGPDGFPVTPPGYSGLFVSVQAGHTRVKFIRYSMNQFAKWTRSQTKRPGVDGTGLSGAYDFYLEFDTPRGAARPAAGEPAEPADPGSDFGPALSSQLGLKLAADKAQIELLIIDHIERTPSGN